MARKRFGAVFDGGIAAWEASGLHLEESFFVGLEFDNLRIDFFRFKRVHEHFGVREDAKCAELKCPNLARCSWRRNCRGS